ncbi:MAG TPA: glycosyltransferase family 4 protein [Ignavibacteriaceae bacterium]|nr:glycosyltransferase family 4 protein [Ignavibacteriaceae bacterium]
MLNKKILFLGKYNESEIIKGPEKVAKRIFDILSSNNSKITFIEYFSEGSKYSYWKKLNGRELKYHNAKSQILKLGIVQLIKELWIIRPDIIHIADFERFQLVAFLFRPFLKYKILYTVHGIAAYEMELTYKNKWAFYELKDKIAEYFYFKLSDKLLFLSKESINKALEYYKFDPSKVQIIANGIDKEFYYAYSQKINRDGSGLKVVFVGDCERSEKGLTFILESLADVNFNIEFFIIGSNYDSKIIEVSSFVNSYVINKMSTTELAAFYENKDIFISASYYDPFSLATVEAMAAGLIPVVTTNTGMSRFIKTGINGFIIKYGEKKELIRTLSKISGDDMLMKSISNEATKIYQELSWENVSEMYLKIYDSLSYD